MNRKLQAGGVTLWLSLATVLLVVFLLVIASWWSSEPDVIALSKNTPAEVSGQASVRALIDVSTTLLDKPGGYLTNDVLPPSVMMDNMASWEFGVLAQVRNLTRGMRIYMARSQSQSTEDSDLAKANPKFNYDNNSWLLPSTESEYREGIAYLKSYQMRLVAGEAGFYPRADNLHSWLDGVEKDLGSLSQRLSASVGQKRIDMDNISGEVESKTPWMQIDNVLYEARGTCWALIHFLNAADKDFADVLQKKQARQSLLQIIRELEETQEPVWSPIVLNGTGFGLMPNYSLVMANYISRANAAIIDLRALLNQG
ncbi:DUF2333 family protein [Pelagibaculum spongiae]|uniref:DUF2333 domain-containing protein n=1 Tax=Pelagibaculum spongiae TaxID=2080658 RepID=A0A2V1H6J4_9GAMM|nr:DUF2333 family protein [Pelagibaculum spongiae]PVZ72385.1 DUF2333 domain-containing protein [Pelagibaculum spongiae]